MTACISTPTSMAMSATSPFSIRATSAAWPSLSPCPSRRSMGRSRRPRSILRTRSADLSEPGIYIDKECYPGIFGGEIHCEITVTNVGETPSDPIDLYDAATLLSGPGAGGGVIVTGVDPRRSRLDLLADPDPRSVVQPAGRRARPGRDPLNRGVPRYRPAVRRRQFRLPQLRRARCALARHRLRRRRHRHHGDQDRAGGVRARRRLHLHRDHHQHRRLPVQRPRAVFRQHDRRLAVPRAVQPADYVDRPCARLRAAPGGIRILLRGPPHARARRVGSLRHHGDDAAGGSVPRLLGPKLLRGLGRGRGGAGFAAGPRRRQPDASAASGCRSARLRP